MSPPLSQRRQPASCALCTQPTADWLPKIDHFFPVLLFASPSLTDTYNFYQLQELSNTKNKTKLNSISASNNSAHRNQTVADMRTLMVEMIAEVVDWSKIKSAERRPLIKTKPAGISWSFEPRKGVLFK